ncbi:MAG: hypothetical protein KBD00_04140 [Candidatus Peribacteraceae bacterium]|nr:hypothetical protein [Candidatus Peribacteraceae bacterium]
MSPLAIGAIAAVVLLSIGGVDYALLEKPHQQELIALENQNPNTPTSQGSSSSRTGVKKGTSTRKRTEIDVPTLFSSLSLTPVDTQEMSILGRVVPPGTATQTNVLLKNNDRSALFSWTDSPDSKTLFGQLKQSLQQSFSGQVRDLQDERIEPETGTSYDILRFTDETISPEHIIFLRVRTRIYEIHVTTGQQPTVDQLIAALVA